MQSPKSELGNVITFPRPEYNTCQKPRISGIAGQGTNTGAGVSHVRGQQKDDRKSRKRKKEPLMSPRNRVMCDGFQRYADKPFTDVKPRPISAELHIFRIEEQRQAEKEARLIWNRI